MRLLALEAVYCMAFLVIERNAGDWETLEDYMERTRPLGDWITLLVDTPRGPWHVELKPCLVNP